MRYLIDGYNLLFALLGPPAGPQGLEAARQRLLDRLLDLPQVDPALLTVVFDARRSPGNMPRELVYRSIHLHFSHNGTADDLIEELIQADSRPQTLTVVSNDHRLQNAAKRRGCPFLDCLDWVEAMKRAPASERDPAAEKPTHAGETEEWLRAFAGIDTTDLDDPEPFLR